MLFDAAALLLTLPMKSGRENIKITIIHFTLDRYYIMLK